MAVQIHVKSTILKRGDKVLDVELVQRVVADDKQPIIGWDTVELILEPVVLLRAVLCQDMLLRVGETHRHSSSVWALDLNIPKCLK